MAEVWRYGYTDFGEGRGRSPHRVLRAVVQSSTPGSSRVWSALIDTGGPITIVRKELLDEGGDPIDLQQTMVLRLAGSTADVALYDLTLEVRPPAGSNSMAPTTWRSAVAVLDPWPHSGTAILLGQAGFLDTFTVTFGPDGFALEPASAFRERFLLDSPRLEEGTDD